MSRAVITTSLGIDWVSEGRIYMVALGFLYILFAGGLAFIAVVSVITYIVCKIVFDKRTNQALADNENGKHKRMIRPIAVTAIVAGSLLVLIACFTAVFLLFGTDCDNGYAGDGYFEPDYPSAELYFMTEETYVEPDSKLYDLVTSGNDKDIDYYVYSRKSDNYTDAQYVIVSVYKGEKVPVSAEGMLSNKYAASGTLVDMDGSEVFYENRLFDVNYPGTLRVSFRDESGAEIALVYIELD